MATFIAHNYQNEALKHILETPKCGIFLEMGLGKTVITLTAIKELIYYRFAVSKVLVIAPKKVAESTWLRETAKWNHTKNLRVVSVMGTASERTAALNKKADIYIINRDNVVWLVKHLTASWPFDMVVVDELSSFKNHQAKRFKALCWVRKHITHLVGLTGTPSPNGLIDLWAQVFLLDGGERLEKTIGGYRSRYFNPGMMSGYVVFNYVPKSDAADTIQRKISDICMSMKTSDYLELPECIVVDVPITLTGKTLLMYKELKKEMVIIFDENIVDASTAAVLSNKLLQLCNGAIYDTERKVIEVHDAKIEALLELVEGLNGSPAIVFYNYQHDLSRILAALPKNLRVRVLKTPEDENLWNSGNVDVLLAHPQSAAYGLNLQDGGHHIIWFSIPWALELYQQANARLHRQGQKSTVIVHRLIVEGGMDQEVARALLDKDVTQNRLMEALKYVKNS